MLLIVLMALAFNEYYNLKKVPEQQKTRMPAILTGALLLIMASSMAMRIVSLSAFLAILFSSLFVLMLITLISGKSSPNLYSIQFGGFLYIVVPLGLAPFLSFNNPEGIYDPSLIISILALIWVYDSFAYLAGITLGKHKMFPSLSPKKSWEGFFGGMAFAILAAYLISLINQQYSSVQWIILALIISVAGTAGDFYESYLKRTAGVKDSGNWLPGHGGILDRFDSFLFAVPCVFIYVTLIIQKS